LETGKQESGYAQDLRRYYTALSCY